MRCKESRRVGVPPEYGMPLDSMRRQIVLGMILRGVRDCIGPAAVLCAAAAALGRWQPGGHLLLVAASLTLLAFLGLVAAACWRYRDWETVADRVDREAGLANAVRSALLFYHRGLSHPIATLQRADACQKLLKLQPASVFPLKLRERPWLPAACLALAAALYFIPGPVAHTRPDQEKITLSPEELGLENELEKLLKEMEEEEDPEVKRVAEEIAKLWQFLERGELTREQALRQLENLQGMAESDVANRLDEILEKLAQIGEEMREGQELADVGKAFEGQEFEEAARRLEDLAGKLDAGRPERLRALNRELTEAAKAAAERDQQRLEELANRASDALQEGDLEKAKRFLDKLAKETVGFKAIKANRSRLSLAQEHMASLKFQIQNCDGSNDEDLPLASLRSDLLELAKAQAEYQLPMDGNAGSCDASAGMGGQQGSNGGAENGASPSSSWGKGSPGLKTGAGDRLDAQFQKVELGGVDSSSGESMVRVMSAASFGALDSASYKRINAEFRAFAEEELTEVKVPLGLKQVVRDYFEVIRPQE